MAKVESTVKTTTLLLFGKTGSGRSATGNSILGRKAFAASPMFNTTKTYQIETCEQDHGNLRVVDTPDITESLDHLPDNDPAREIAKWLVETKDGIDAVLLIHKFGVRFTDQQKTLLGALENYFGKDIYKHSIIVLTHGDQVQEAVEDGSLTSIEDYVSEDWGGLPKLMKKVDNRYVVFNNRTENEDEKKKQVERLMDFVKQVWGQNKGPYKSPHCSRIVTSATSTDPKTPAASTTTTDTKPDAASATATDPKIDGATTTTTDPKATGYSATATDPKAGGDSATTESSADPHSLFEKHVDIVQKAIKPWYDRFVPSLFK